MHLSRQSLPLIPLCITGALANFLGPTYLAPLDLTSDESLVSASWANVTSILDAYLNGNQSTASNSFFGLENITFSSGLFSIHDPAAAESLQYYYTSTEIANAPEGANQVDGNSIYRVASVSKLVTVFLGMLELNSEDWNRPLTNILPGLAEFARENSRVEDPVYITQWDKVTPWALAAQIAGVARQGLPVLDTLYQYEVAKATGDESAQDPTTHGLPPVSLSELGPCAESTDLFCAGGPYVGSVQTQPPTFLP